MLLYSTDDDDDDFTLFVCIIVFNVLCTSLYALLYVRRKGTRHTFMYIIWGVVVYGEHLYYFYPPQINKFHLLSFYFRVCCWVWLRVRILYYIIVLVFLMIIFQSSLYILFFLFCIIVYIHITHNITYPLISLDTRKKRMLGYYNEDFHLHVYVHTWYVFRFSHT